MSSRKNNSTIHLPAPWPEPRSYEHLCAETIKVREFHDFRSPWKEIRIRPGSTAEQVYRQLPSHLDYEYAGYLTPTRIRYRRCGRVHSYLPPKQCTFHSHPTALQRGEPDVPSAMDIRLFLFNWSWRTITVGRTLLWVLDKTAASFGVIRQLAAWDRDNLSIEARKLEGRFPDWPERLAARGLAEVGIVMPRRNARWAAEWPDQLRRILHFRVYVIGRDC